MGVYSASLFCNTVYTTLILTVSSVIFKRTSMDGAWALHWNIMFVSALTVSLLESWFDVTHPSHPLTLIYISQMCQERPQDVERRSFPKLQ